MRILPLLPLLLSTGVALRHGRGRTCCPYWSGNPDSTCSSSKDCVLVDVNGGLLESPPGERCSVVRDTKRSNASGTDCLGDESFDVDLEDRDDRRTTPVASVSPYVLSMDGAKRLPAVNVKVDYSLPWKRLRSVALITKSVSPPKVPQRSKVTTYLLSTQ